MAVSERFRSSALVRFLAGCGLTCGVALMPGCSPDADRPSLLAGLSPLYSFTDRLPEARISSDRVVLDFGAYSSQDRLVAGWGTPESEPVTGTTFVWAVAEEASVVVELPSAEAATIAFSCWPFTYEGAPRQIVEVFVNGRSAGRVTLQPGARTYRLAPPDGALLSGANTIAFRFAYAESPLDHGGGDSRKLAVAFDALTIGSDAGSGDVAPRVVDESLVVPAGAAVVFTFRAPEQPVLNFDRVTFETGSAVPVAGEVWVRQPGTSFERLGVVDNVGGASRKGWRLPLAAPGGSLVQVKLRTVIASTEGEGPHEVVWYRPWLYGRQAGLEPLEDVLLIVVDTLRADHVGAYGGEVATPNIDALADRGVLFRNAYSHIPITGPSHASIFTSLLPVDHGVHNNGQILDRELDSLPELLASWGRHTAAFVSLGVLKSRFGFGRGFDSYHDQFGWDWMKNASELNREVFDWIDGSPPGPRFLWLHYSDPHEPYAPPGLEYPRVRVTLGGQELTVVAADGRGASLALDVEPGRHVLGFETVGDTPQRGIRFPILRITDDRVGLRLKSGWSEHDKRFGRSAFDTLLPASAELVNRTGGRVATTLEFSCKERLTVPEIRQRYQQEVAFVDQQIGALMARLDETGRLDRTLVILTSDHGEGLGDHDHVGHISQLYGSLIRVPLIFVAPGRLAGGRQIDHPVALVDVAPTVAELLGLHMGPGVRGRSLVPLLEGGDLPEGPIIAETYRPEAYSDKQAVISGGFKYIWSRRDHVWVELYDLAEDPGEQNDLSGQRAELVSELRRVLDHEFESSRRSPSVEADISEEDAARLRALGYVH